MPDFLLELLSEEVPARMQAKASMDLARLFAERIGEAGLYSQGMESFATPRRLVLIARGLPAETEPASEEIKGPRASAPPQALEGFLRKTGLAREQLVERDGILFAVMEKPGRTTAAVIAEAVPALIRNFPWPKSMRWGAGSAAPDSIRWVRPLHGIIALLGEEIVEFEAAGIGSGAATMGHRFHHPGVITIGSANDYAEKLRACRVILEPAERRRLIAEGARKAAATAGLALVEDEGLLDENAGLTEWPVALLGSFDPAFLDVPREVIQLTMRANQKYFALNDDQGQLAPSFVCVANIEAADGGAKIVAGNERVLSARLSDARYFWEQDLKVPLERQAQKLDQIIFHERLGNLSEKVERVARIARWIVEKGIVKAADAGQAETAARLCKADLVSQMVGEFPELQGVIGGYLARAQGQPDAIADAIRDHYKPAGQGDEVPTAPLTVAVSLADKLDTIAGFFAIDERPTGSRDPFGTRRSAISIIALIVENKLRVDLGEALDTALRPFTEIASQAEADAADTGVNLFEFLIDRLKVQQRDAGVRHDLIDAVFALGGETDLVRLLARVKALQAFVQTAEGNDLLTGYKRAANILKRENWIPTVATARPKAETVAGNEAAWAPGPAGMPKEYASEPEEAALIAALDAAEPRAGTAVAAEDFEGAMAALASLRRPVDDFFDKVTVNDADPGKRETRLNLLARMREAVHKVADFSKIEG